LLIPETQIDNPRIIADEASDKLNLTSNASPTETLFGDLVLAKVSYSSAYAQKIFPIY